MHSKTSDQLILRGIQVETLIGLLAEERQARQALEVSLTLEMDFSHAAHTDALDDIVNYAEVVETVRSFAEAFHDYTLERFADRLAFHIKERFPMVQTAGVRVSKPRYAGPLGLASIEVYVER